MRVLEADKADEQADTDGYADLQCNRNGIEDRFRAVSVIRMINLAQIPVSFLDSFGGLASFKETGWKLRHSFFFLYIIFIIIFVIVAG